MKPVKLYGYKNSTLPLYNFINLEIQLYEQTESVTSDPQCTNYWLSDVLYPHTTQLETVVPRGFFDSGTDNYIVIQLVLEGITLDDSSLVKHKIQKIVDTVPAEKIIVMVNSIYQANYLQRFFPNLKNILVFNFWEMLVRSHMPMDLSADPEHRRRFLYLNRRNTPERSRLFSLLWSDRRFAKNSYTSFNPGNYWDEGNRRSDGLPDPDKHNSILNSILDELPEDIQQWFKTQKYPRLPARYGSDNPYEYNFIGSSIAQAHVDTDINIIVESNAVPIPQRFFSTEKIYRPLAVGQPFMVLAQPHYYQYLKTLGYATYQIPFGEKHDEIPNTELRINKFASAVLAMSNLKQDSFDQVLDRTRAISKHNREVFLRRTDLESVALVFTGPAQPLAKYLRYSPF